MQYSPFYDDLGSTLSPVANAGRTDLIARGQERQGGRSSDGDGVTPGSI